MDTLLSGDFAKDKELGFQITPAQEQLFAIYAHELILGNRRASLTTITDPGEIRLKHFLDSLTCLWALPPDFPCRRVLDVGSGAGFPGLPLKIYRPEWEVALLESTGKKVAFLQHVVERLGLRGVQLLNGRAELLGHDPAHRERYDLVVARAVAALAVLAEYCLPFCRVGGLFVAQKKSGIAEEIANAEGAIGALGGVLARLVPVSLPGVEPRQLVVVEKVKPTPPRFPRRPGMPAKHPLVSKSR